uniref:Receptor-like serine/threonine-protein kinase n=1 Tax=Fagus sylvatica TaxID=28930 RepID=A0A2N9ER54_FAGSY
MGSDTIFPGQSLSGNHTITSPGGIFQLGFFTPGNSLNYYIGIWYKKLPIQTVVWVANREQPVSNPSFSALKLFENGNLVLLNQSKTAIWSTSSASKVSNSSIAMLLDNGNFVVRDSSNSSILIWQSFDHLTDTWLPGAKLGYNKLTKEKYILTPWRSIENPAPALFSLEVEQNGTSHLLLWNESKVYWTSGNWTGEIFSLVPEIQLNYYVKDFTYVANKNESYFIYYAALPSAYTRFVLDVTGQLKQYVWGKDFTKWNLFWMRPSEQCQVYAFCGAFSICNQREVFTCDCLKGFEPRTLKDWELGDHSDGCVRKTPLQCSHEGNDTFLVMPSMHYPINSEPVAAENAEECEIACLSNCSCTAYAYDNGCLVWKGDLFSLQQLSSNENIGRDFHFRIAASELIGTTAKVPRAEANRKTTWVVIGVVAGFFFVFGIVLVFIKRRKSAGEFEAVEDSLVLFKYQNLRRATKNFSEKLGEGGFGSVFRGILPNSTAIAVKKLKSLPQGEKQFRSEVRTIGTIQHINLVRLRGFCAEASERLLVYDYMPNGSLESLLFKKTTNILDWKTRYHISIGTARGLAYLHEECRDCIIHCDINPENILLDAEYNPKVADFGLAKLIGRDFSRALTTMRGTRGYLAPEWISGEAVTPKADVFSYGMLLFEVISGCRNRDLLDDGTDDYFPARVAYRVNKREDVLTLSDYRLEGNVDVEELVRVCKTACWCVQDHEKDRPSMGQVVQFLEKTSGVDVPPIPQFLQHLANTPAEATMSYY